MNDGNDLLVEAKKRLPLSALMVQLGLGDRVKRAARCPFHDDSIPSFSFYTKADGEERWNCFAGQGCGGGDAIDFLAKHRGLNNADACREFIRLSGVTPQPAPRVESPTTTSQNQKPVDWPACVAALTPEHRQKLAGWRGYTLEFMEWLHGQSLIGLFAGQHYAFPVHDAAGNVIGCHYYLARDGSWRYEKPPGTGCTPFIVGDAATAKRVFLFESQWDSLATIGILNHHTQPLPNTAAVATRGAKNDKSIIGLFCPDATVFAFGQNDKAGKEWLLAVAAHCADKSFRVVATPSAHKDQNDWVRAGATAADICRAIDEAQQMALPTIDMPPAAKKVSIPTLIEETEEPETAAFPLDVLPPVMAGMIAAVSRCERVPVTLPAVCALGVVSAAIGAGLEVASGPNRFTRGNVFLLASAESGSGKSETFRVIAAPLVDYQAQRLETWKLKIAPQIQAESRVIDKEIALLERKAAKSQEPAEQNRLVGELEFKLARKEELARRAVMPCIIAQDVTTERLAVLLRDHNEVAFSSSADARKLVDNLMGRYNPGKTTDESLYLSAYSGDFVRVDRQGRDPVVLNRPCLALCWFIQPDLLATLLDEDSLSVSGFLPRLLICQTNAVPRRIEGEPQTLPEAVREQWLNRVNDLLAAFHAASSSTRITTTPEAVAVLTAYHNQIVDRRSADLADVGAFAARYAENAWRISVVLHAAQWGRDAAREQLSAETATSAVRIVEWFTASQLDILAKGRQSASVKLEDEVFELIEANRQRRSQDFTTAREVHRARIAATPDAAKALLARMESNGLLMGNDVRPEHGGKTTRIYRRVPNPVPE